MNFLLSRSTLEKAFHPPTQHANPSPSSPFETQVFTPSELSLHPTLVHALANLANTALYEHENFDTAPRFANDEEVCEELGANGLCVAMFVREPDGSVLFAKPVACIMAKDYEPPIVQEGSNNLSIRTNYRIYAVACLNAPQYRKKGLIEICLNALERALSERIKAQSQNTDVKPKLNIWLETAEETNGPYWRRRGFKVIKSESKPAGYWAAKKEFVWIVMLRDVDGGT